MDFYTHRQVVRWVASYRYARKLLIMNGFLFILLLFSFQLFAGNGMAQKVSLKFRDAKVEEVFRELERQTGFSVFYFAKDIAAAKPISVQCASCTLTEALDAIKDGQPFEFMVTGNTIALRARPGPVVTPGETTPPDGRITGRVTDPNGAPLGGATIILKRTGMGTQANANGEFRLEGVQEDDVLLISFTGFQQKAIKVGKGSQFPVMLEIAVKELDQFVYRGYGKISNRLNVGNIATVTGEEIARTNVANPMRALIGKVPNMEVSALAGNPYAPTKIEIRGRRAINDLIPPNPYILIDGVPTTILDVGGQSNTDGTTGVTQNGFNGPAGGQDILFNLNPDDIESITVLKDAAATAIYGSLGGSGVILITTKKGRAGKLKLDITANTGISKVTNYYDLMNTSEYLMMRREAYRNSNMIPDIFDAPDLLSWDSTKNTDFQKYLYGRTGINHNFNVSISGGEKNTTYRISATYSRISNITNFSGANTRASLQSNFNYTSSDQRLKVGLVTVFSNTKVDEISLSATESLLPPNVPAIFDSAGMLNYKGWEPISYMFPFSSLLSPYESKTDFVNTSGSLEYNLITGLKISANLGFSTSRNMQIGKTPIVAQDPGSYPTGTAQFGSNNNSKWIVEPLITYQRLIGTNKIEVLVGGTIQKITQNGSSVIGSGYVNDNLLGSISNAPTLFGTDVWGQYKYVAAFGRINFSHRDKYLLDVSARRDGSSRFGPGYQYGNFGAIGLGWIVSEERWFERFKKVVSFLKFRSSFGIVGSDNIGDYNFISRWSSSSSNVTPYQGVTSYVPTRLFNPDLHWQETKKGEIGVHLGLLNDAIVIQGSIYADRCGNQLVNYPLPNISGFASVLTNRNAVVENRGFEIDVRGTIVKSKNIQCVLNFNFGLNRNKLVSFPDLANSSYSSYLVVGEPLGRPQVLKYIGVDPETGKYMIEDLNKDGVITQKSPLIGGDRYFVNDANVRFGGGFGCDFNWKGLSVNAFFNYVKRPKLAAPLFSSTIPGTFSLFGNQSVKLLDRWTKPGDVARFARYTVIPDASDFYIMDSDGIFSNGSFVRMRSLSIGYSVPSSLLSKIGVSNLKIIAKGDNLFTLTKYEGVDPEVPFLGSVPTQKVISFGLQMTL